ncbi:MAG TPA: T9SS type A sorting domain-containing protein [Flavipsychrobacter sp.]|nr:T9SS type A sorting domain-containing protein [Flavipsychrobacter sp.]
MKYLFTLLMIVTALFSKAQVYVGTSLEFSDSLYQDAFEIDTVNYPDNLWQIGQPQKTIFVSAYSGQRAIVTDTLNPYLNNDTSVFSIKIPGYHPIIGWGFGVLSNINFQYRLDIDSGDIGILEFSKDSGQSWTNLTTDSTFLIWNSSLPHFDSSTNGWQHCSISCGFFPDSYPDSIYFRFTFISDSNSSNKDGWIIDDFKFQYFFSGVNEAYNNNHITLYPNPSSGHIKLHSKTGAKKANIQVTNLSGQKVYETTTSSDTEDLNLPLPDGVYILRYSDETTTTIKRLIIQH